MAFDTGLEPMDVDEQPTLAGEIPLRSGEGPCTENDEEQDIAAIPPRIVEIEDIEAPRKRWREPFPVERGAGAGYRRGKTSFEHIRDDQILKGAEVLGPFKDDDEWELAKWLIKNVGHTAADAFLRLPIVSLCCVKFMQLLTKFE